MRAGDVVTVDIEKAAAGGRMLARHHGQVVLVSGAIPGERLAVGIERVTGAVVFASTLEVIEPSPDRRLVRHEPRCGGGTLAHVAYARQQQLKAEIVQDAFNRIARFPLRQPPAVIAADERGYRMRFRLHAQGSRLGFYLEGSHQLCDAGETGQLSDATVAWIRHVERLLAEHHLEGLTAAEIVENMRGDERACHLELRGGCDASPFHVLAAELTGLSAQRADSAEVVTVGRPPAVTDLLTIGEGQAPASLMLRRHARAFFQANRFLVGPLMRHVVAQMTAGPVVDLYAGVGLFGLAAATTGTDEVTLVEGDPVSGADLEVNAKGVGGRVRVERRSVEAFVGSSRFRTIAAPTTTVVDPPRTGLSKEVLRSLCEASPRRIIYVSCDPATLARDCRGFLSHGYDLTGLTVFDMFPNTAHVETVVVLDK